MARQFTGIDGALYLEGNKVARVSNWALQASADTLDTTTLGDHARTSVYGIQAFGGSCTIYYYEDDKGKIQGGDLLGDVLRTDRTPVDKKHSMELRFENGASPHRVSFDCLLNQVSIAASAGQIITAQVSFTVTGPLKTASLA